MTTLFPDESNKQWWWLPRPSVLSIIVSLVIACVTFFFYTVFHPVAAFVATVVVLVLFGKYDVKIKKKIV